MTTAVNNMVACSPLYALVTAALEKFPALAYKDGGSRAEAAAAYVGEERVRYLGMAEGYDWWQVGTYRTSVKLGRCTCEDRGAPTDDKGKLCKHRLAAMFAVKLGLAQQQPSHRRRGRKVQAAHV